MAGLRYTVIIPMRHFKADEPALTGLRETPPPQGTAQILVVEGIHPARQRNAALAVAEGEIVVFLDNDCRVGPDFWKQLEADFARPEVEIVGGPALLRTNATPLEQIFHALLTHVLIVGTVSARYAPRGQFRPATQTDLILCNLTVRKSIFAKIGPLSTDLYPNEENEWLDRAHEAGIGAYYDPQLQVSRPQRSTFGQMARMLLRYGMGRTRQFWVSAWRPTFHQFLPLMLIATLAALFYWSLEWEFVFLWLVASTVIAFSCDPRLRVWQRVVAGLMAPAIPLIYCLGQIVGWFALLIPTPHANSEVSLFDEQGNQIVQP
jgi:GT2 family glycosyltransferase